MPSVFTSAYDTADTALNFARVHANDAGLSLQGSPGLLSDFAPGTFALLNIAWRMLQRVMTNYGIGTFVKTFQLSSIPVAGSADPGAQCYISFTGMFDGVNMQAGPVLPSDMAGPLRLRERQSGVQQRFCPMFPANDGLPQRVPGLWFRQWNWENDVLNFVGSTQVNDIQLRYNSFLQDIVPDINGLGSTQLPILRCADALGAYTAAAFGASRGSQATSALMAIGDAAVKQMAMTSARQKQRGNHRRIPYSSRAMYGDGWGNGWSI